MKNYGLPDLTPFVPFADWFSGGIRNRDRNIDFNINLTPVRVYNPRMPECSRVLLGCFKYIAWMDFFG